MKVLFTIKVDSVIDVITNSSSELFVFEGKTQSVVEEMLESIYPDYKKEYYLKDIRTLSCKDIENYCYWVLGRIDRYNWDSTKIYNKKKDYIVLPGFKFEELYNTIMKKNDNEYRVLGWHDWNIGKLVNDSNRDRFIKGLEKLNGRWLLYSREENPDDDYQEKLEIIGKRYHLG